MPVFFFILVAMSVVAWLRRPDLRREMVWAGVIALPLVVIEYALVDWSAPFDAVSFVIRAGTIALFGAVAAVVYEIVFRRALVPGGRPDRRDLWWLGSGLLVFVLAVGLFDWPWLIALMAGLVAEVIVIVVRRRDILWDLIVSAGGMAVLYAVAWLITGQVGGGDVVNLLFRDQVIGVTIAGFPIEGLLTAILFGAVWGPLYAVAKHRDEIPQITTPVHRRTRFIVAVTIVLVAGGGTAWAATQFALPPVLESSTPTNNQKNVAWSEPIRLKFSAPMNRDAVGFSIEPAVDGAWTFTDPTYGDRAYRTLVFTPDTILEPGTAYRVDLKNIESLAGTGTRDYTVSFTTASLPTVTATPPTAPIEPCATLTLPLDQTVDADVSFTARVEPAAEITTTVVADPPAVQLAPTNCFAHATAYRVLVERHLLVQSRLTGERVEMPVVIVNDSSVVTSDPPNVSELQPVGSGVKVTTTEIRLSFGRGMPPVTTEAIVLAPRPTGAWNWVDPQTAVYALTAPLTHATTYTVTIPAGTRDTVGGFFPKAESRTFTTIGAAAATITPANGAAGITTKTAVTVTWDQAVDREQAEAALTITPTVPGAVTWDGNRAVFTPTNGWSSNTTYTVKIAAGVASADGGLPSSAEFTSTFASETTKVLLPIALDYQDKPLSCEAAALKMALAGKGVNVSENQIMSIVGYDTTAARGKTWGDPNVGFVGNISGHQNTTGYGVHWDPIARAASRWRRAEAFTGWSTSKLAETLAAGNPVVIWGVLGNAYADPWKTPAGTTIAAWKGEHARTAIGFLGPVSAPTHFIINDPIVGRVTWTTAKLRSDWGKFNNSGVVVY